MNKLNMTLAEAKSHIKENWIEGVECPCCGQNVQKNEHRLSASMVTCLIELYRATDGDINKMIHIQKLQDSEVFRKKMNGGAFSQLRFWKLISENQHGVITKRPAKGVWRITKLGVDFVMGKSKVPHSIYKYNMRFLGYGKKKVSIKDIMGNGSLFV